MKHVIKRAWDDMVVPLLQRPKRLQVAALCFRETETGKEVLLITSRDTGRWIVPKGWPINGKDGAQSALQEAWEEAGVSKADIQQEPLGSYEYTKELDSGAPVSVETLVYLAHVRELQKTYPEVEERKRVWVTPEEAATRVDEPELKAILKAL